VRTGAGGHLADGILQETANASGCYALRFGIQPAPLCCRSPSGSPCRVAKAQAAFPARSTAARRCGAIRAVSSGPASAQSPMASSTGGGSSGYFVSVLSFVREAGTSERGRLAARAGAAPRSQPA
jgi:hypothetical protein